MAKIFKYILDFKAQTDDFEKGVGGVEGMLKGVAAVAAAAFAADKIIDAAEAVYEYATEVSNTKIAVETLADVHGAAANKMTGQVTALAQSYDQDINETVKASNVLMRAFGEDSQKAFDLFNTGFSGAANANGDLLKQVSEYSPHFAEAGATAEEMFAVIAQGNKLGVFDDKAADSIKEASIRLREMTDSTKTALDGIGLSSEQIQADISSGSKSMFEVMQEVSGKLKELPAQAPEVGAALADIFGGPGEDGINFIRTLADVDTSMNGLIGDSVAAQMEWTEELARFHEIGAAAFGGFSEAILGIKTAMLSAANFVLENFNAIRNAAIAGGAAFVTYKGIMLASTAATKGMTLVTKAAAIAQKALNTVMKANPIGIVITAIMAAVAAFTMLYNKNEEFRIRVDYAAKWAAAALNKAWVSIKMGAEMMWLGIKTYFTAIPKSAKAIWTAVKRVLKGEKLGDVLKEEFSNLVTDAADQATAIKEKYNEKLQGIEMPEWAEFYDSEKAKSAAEEAGKDAANAYNDGLSDSNAVAKPEITILPKLVVKDFDLGELDDFDTSAIGEQLSEKFILETSLGLVANEMDLVTQRAKAFGSEIDVLGQKKSLLKDQINTLISEGYDTEGEAIQGLLEEYGKVAEQQQTSIGMQDLLSDALGSVSSSLLEGADSLDEYGTQMGNSVRSAIGALIAQGTAALVTAALESSTALGPLALAAAPVLAAAAGGLAKTLFNTIIPTFEHGNIAYGPTLGIFGEYPNASINPEVTGKLSDLQGMIGTGDSSATSSGPVVMDVVLKGEDLVLQQRKAESRLNRRN